MIQLLRAMIIALLAIALLAIALLAFAVIDEGYVIHQVQKRVMVIKEEQSVIGLRLGEVERDMRRTGELRYRLDEVSPDREI